MPFAMDGSPSSGYAGQRAERAFGVVGSGSAARVVRPAGIGFLRSLTAFTVTAPTVESCTDPDSCLVLFGRPGTGGRDASRSSHRNAGRLPRAGTRRRAGSGADPDPRRHR